MERPWIPSYPPGVPAEIDLGTYASIPDILETSCRRFAELPAISLPPPWCNRHAPHI